MDVNKPRIILCILLLAIWLGADAKTYLVSVGISDYTGFPSKINNLQLPTNDAKGIVDIYANNSDVDYAILLDSKATKSRIQKAIKKVFRLASENDIVIFYFSGHGYPGGLCAVDGRLGYAKIREAMAESKSKNKMMFVDACHAGAIRVEAQASNNAMSQAKKANVLLFLSSRNTETSLERPFMQNGLFTTFILKGLGGYADTNSDRVISAKELFNYVSKNVAESSQDSQHPVMWGNFAASMPVMIWK